MSKLFPCVHQLAAPTENIATLFSSPCGSAESQPASLPIVLAVISCVRTYVPTYPLYMEDFYMLLLNAMNSVNLHNNPRCHFIIILIIISHVIIILISEMMKLGYREVE